MSSEDNSRKPPRQPGAQPLSRRQLLQSGLLASAALWPGFQGLWGATATPAGGPANARAKATAKKWNILTILTDDQAIWGMGAYGNPEIRTPVLDRLAQDGALFTNAFAASGVCTPSRVAFLTGKHSVEIGSLNDAILPANAKTQGLPPKAPLWPRELKREGYTTALFGKWHLGDQPEFYPTRFGYDYFFGFLGGTNAGQNPALTRNGETRIVKGYTDDLVTDDALSWLEQNGNKPFAVSMHFRAPHRPYNPLPPEDAEAVKDINPAMPPTLPTEAGEAVKGVTEQLEAHIRKERREYYGLMHCVDRNVGRILDKLKALGLEENTIVLFTSDQGYMLGERGLIEKGGAFPVQSLGIPDFWFAMVMNMYDLSLRVPFLVKWPGVVAPGTRIDELVSLIDVYPSILSMANVRQESPISNDARDFLPLLLGEDVPWRDVLFSQYTPDQVGNIEFLRMARTKDWKLIRTHMNAHHNQLFDMAADPQELNNLYYPRMSRKVLEDGRIVAVTEADQHAGVRNDLQRQLTEWQTLIEDPALELEASYESALARKRRRYQ